MSGEAPSEIAEKLVDSGTITEEEKYTYFAWGTEYSAGTPEEKATHDKVEQLVNEWKDGKPPTLSGNEPNPDTEMPEDKPKDPLDDPAVLPPPLNTSGEKGGSVTVSTEALRQFAKNLKVLEDLVVKEHTAVKDVKIAPGTFGAGVHISAAIQTGLRGDTLRFLQSVSETFTYIRADIETLITDYDSTEEWNGITAQQLNNVFNDAFTNISHYGQYGNSSTDGTGTENEGDGDGEGENT
jgi:hypothetical protein